MQLCSAGVPEQEGRGGTHPSSLNGRGQECPFHQIVFWKQLDQGYYIYVHLQLEYQKFSNLLKVILQCFYGKI